MSKKGKQMDIDEVVEDVSELWGQKVIKETRRADGSLDVSYHFDYCPSMAEQHTAHLSDINWLIKKYQPDELAAYIASKNAHRMEIKGHDFSHEPNLQEGMNEAYRLKQEFLKLPDNIKNQFQNHVEFLKFIDNPINQDKLVNMGLLTRKDVAELTSDAPPQVDAPKDKELKK